MKRLKAEEIAEIDLMRRIGKGDKDAFESLYRETHQSVYFFLYPFVRNQTAAEDLLSEVYLQVWRSAKTFKGQSRPKTWIFGIARNIALNARKRQPHTDPIENHAYLTDPSEHQGLERWELKQLVQKAMERVSHKHREVLELILHHHMNYEEISQILKISINTVKTRVFHAKNNLRDIFKEMGIQSNDLLF